MRRFTICALTVAVTLAVGSCNDKMESPPTGPEADLDPGEGVGTPVNAPIVPSPAPPSSAAAALVVGGPDIGILAYCTDLTGFNGASNTANTLVADGRFGSVTVVDGDVVLPTASDLLADFDAVIAMTDSRCGVPIPQATADAAADAMTGFVGGGGGVVLAVFGFSERPNGGIGFGASIFGTGLSPLQQALPFFNAPAGAINVAGASATPPCDALMDGVTSVSSAFANFVSLSSGATLCASYTNGRLLLAINATGNVVGLNTFPAQQTNNTQASYQKLVSNAVFQVSNQPPAFEAPTPADGDTLAVIANDTITIDVQATDPDVGETVTLGATMTPTPSTAFSFTPNPPVNETTTGAFTWTPTVADHFLGTPPTLRTYTVVFTAEDNFGASADPVSVTIEVLPDPCEGLVDCNAEIVVPGEATTVELEVGETIVASYEVEIGKYTVAVVITTQLLAGPAGSAPSSSPFGFAAVVDDLGCHHEFLLNQDGNCLNVVVENADGSGPPGPTGRNDDPVIIAVCSDPDQAPDPDSKQLLFRYNETDGDVVALENVPADLNCSGLDVGDSPNSNGFIRFASGLLNRARQWLAPRPAFAAAAIMREDRGLGGRMRTSDNFIAVWAEPSIKISAGSFDSGKGGMGLEGTLLDFNFSAFFDPENPQAPSPPVRVTFGDPDPLEGGFGFTIPAGSFKLQNKKQLFQYKPKGKVSGVKHVNLNFDGTFQISFTNVLAALTATVDLDEPTHRFMSFTVLIGSDTDLHGTGIHFKPEVDEDGNLIGVFDPDPPNGG